MSYYGYKARDKEATVDWGAITKTVTDRLATEKKRRVDLKSSLQDQTDKTISNLSDIPTGKDTTANERVMIASQNSIDYMLMQNKLLKQNKIKPSDYSRGSQNLTDDWKSFSAMTKTYQDDYAKVFENASAGDLSFVSQYSFEQYENFLDPSKGSLEINPITGRLAIKDTSTGNYVSVHNAKNRGIDNTLKYDPTAETKAFAESIGKSVVLESNQSVEDVTNTDAYKKSINSFIGSQLENQRNILDLLASDDEFDKEDLQKLLIVNDKNIYIPDPDKVGTDSVYYKRAKEILQERIDVQMDNVKKRIDPTYETKVKINAKAAEKVDREAIDADATILMKALGGDKDSQTTVFNNENLGITSIVADEVKFINQTGIPVNLKDARDAKVTFNLRGVDRKVQPINLYELDAKGNLVLDKQKKPIRKSGNDIAKELMLATDRYNNTQIEDFFSKLKTNIKLADIVNIGEIEDVDISNIQVAGRGKNAKAVDLITRLSSIPKINSIEGETRSDPPTSYSSLSDMELSKEVVEEYTDVIGASLPEGYEIQVSDESIYKDSGKDARDRPSINSSISNLDGNRISKAVIKYEGNEYEIGDVFNLTNAQLVKKINKVIKESKAEKTSGKYD